MTNRIAPALALFLWLAGSALSAEVDGWQSWPGGDPFAGPAGQNSGFERAGPLSQEAADRASGTQSALDSAALDSARAITAASLTSACNAGRCNAAQIAADKGRAAAMAIQAAASLRYQEEIAAREKIKAALESAEGVTSADRKAFGRMFQKSSFPTNEEVQSLPKALRDPAFALRTSRAVENFLLINQKKAAGTEKRSASLGTTIANRNRAADSLQAATQGGGAREAKESGTSNITDASNDPGHTNRNPKRSLASAAASANKAPAQSKEKGSENDRDDPKRRDQLNAILASLDANTRMIPDSLKIEGEPSSKPGSIADLTALTVSEAAAGLPVRPGINQQARSLASQGLPTSTSEASLVDIRQSQNSGASLFERVHKALRSYSFRQSLE